MNQKHMKGKIYRRKDACVENSSDMFNCCCRGSGWQ